MYTGDTHCGVQFTGAEVLGCLSEHEASVLFNHCIEPCFCINLFLISVIKTIIKDPEEKRDFWLPLPNHSPSLWEAKAGTQEK